MAATQKIKTLLTNPIRWPKSLVLKDSDKVNPTKQELAEVRAVLDKADFRLGMCSDSIRRYCAAHAVAMYREGGVTLAYVGETFGVEAGVVNQWIRAVNEGHLIQSRGRPAGRLNNATLAKIEAPTKHTARPPVAKRGRGRPAKAKAELVSVAVPKRGRPAKVKVAGLGVVSIAPKKRGRPSKAVAVTEAKRGRGRPAKVA